MFSHLNDEAMDFLTIEEDFNKEEILAEAIADTNNPPITNIKWNKRALYGDYISPSEPAFQVSLDRSK